MPFAYPVFLELSGKRAVVIGAQAVAEGKAAALAAAGAEVTVLENGAWSPADLEGAFVCVAHSSDPAERDAIALAARDRGVLVNVMDDVSNCDFAAPAVVRRGDLVLAISTGGRSPALARKLREELEDRFGPEWADVVDVLLEVRKETLALLPDLPERSRRWSGALDLEEAATLVASGRRDELKTSLLGRLLGQEVGA
ncbi:MAG: bifunctional precorrin-2 dehydrogenase/sirohydrochlorin ferrochelatase [Actinobacteria bacterium]|nr:MAG: bifunctional precorrin-2 dehydrogenase/sirohydrochlorin ferrochelatase [Actinomycetota bacterium]